MTHDSQVHIVNMRDLSKITDSVLQWKGRAFYKAAFTADEELFCCGYDRTPVLYQQVPGKEGEYVEKAALDDLTTKAKVMTAMEQRMSVFEQKKLGQASEEVEYLHVPKFRHKNTIMFVFFVEG